MALINIKYFMPKQFAFSISLSSETLPLAICLFAKKLFA